MNYTDEYNEQNIYKMNPIDLYTEERLDIGLRIIILHMVSKGDCPLFYKKLYAKMILARSGAYEPNEYFSIADTKNNVEDFIKSGLMAYEGIMEKGFNQKKFIPLNQNSQVIDGAHRIAAAILLNKPVYVQRFKYGQVYPFSYGWFKKHKFNDFEMLIILKKYAEFHNSDLCIAFDNNMITKSEVVASVHIFITNSANIILKKQLYSYGCGYWPKYFSGYLKFVFLKRKLQVEEKQLLASKMFKIGYSTYVDKTLSLNNLFYSNRFIINPVKLKSIKTLAIFLNDEIEQEFAVYGINPFDPCSLDLERKIGIATKTKLEKRVRSKIKKVIDVDFVVTEDDRMFQENNVYYLFGIALISPEYISENNHNMPFIRNEKYINQCKHYSDYFQRIRREYKEKMHLLNGKIDYFMVNDWRH